MGDTSIDSAKIPKKVSDLRNMFESNIQKPKVQTAETLKKAAT